MSNLPVAIVWPEGEPNKAQFAYSWYQRLWLQWSIGIKSFWPDPRQAKRVTAAKWWWINDAGKSPEQIAILIERGFCYER